MNSEYEMLRPYLRKRRIRKLHLYKKEGIRKKGKIVVAEVAGARLKHT